MAKITIFSNGTGTLTVKVLDRECMPSPPGSADGLCHPIHEAQHISLTPRQVAMATKLLEAVPWTDQAAQVAGRGSEDGADWVFEERNGDDYRYADFRQATPPIQYFTRLVFWQWSHLLPADEQLMIFLGVYTDADSTPFPTHTLADLLTR